MNICRVGDMNNSPETQPTFQGREAPRGASPSALSNDAEALRFSEVFRCDARRVLRFCLPGLGSRRRPAHRRK